MTRYSKPSIALAVCLSALAGYVDARGLLGVGYFVSFMSGNSTRLGIVLGQGAAHQAETIAAIVVTFVSGVVLGTLIGHAARSYRPPAVLSLVAFLLTIAALSHHYNFHTLGYGAMILAMGAENAIFQEGGEVTIGLTYMTGTLVKMGQRIAGALLGGPRFAWVPYACLWLGLVGGATIGAVVGLRGLWFAALYAACLIPAARRVSHQTARIAHAPQAFGSTTPQ